MHFIQFLLAMFAALGINIVIVEGTILSPVRKWVLNMASHATDRRRESSNPDKHIWNWIIEGMNCMLCAGGWGGLVIGILYAVAGKTFGLPEWLWIVSFTFTSAAIGALVRKQFGDR